MASSLLLYDGARRTRDLSYLAARGDGFRRRLDAFPPHLRELLLAGRILNANNPEFYDATVEAALNAVAAMLNSGFIKIYTGSQPALDGSLTGTLLATMTFGATAFGSASASAGTVTAAANSITSGTAGNTGTAGYHALVKSDGVTVVATGSVGTSGADLNMNTLSVTSGNTVSCSSYTLSEPQT